MLEGGINYGCSIQNTIPNFRYIESQFENEINSLESALNYAKQLLESTAQKSIDEVTETVKEQIQETMSDEEIKEIVPDEEEYQSFSDKMESLERSSGNFQLPEPWMGSIVLSDWGPDPGDNLTISGKINSCKDSSEKVRIKIHYQTKKEFL